MLFSLARLVQTPFNQLGAAVSPGKVDHPHHRNNLHLFEEAASEQAAAIREDFNDVTIFDSSWSTPANFGTIDNPALIFSSDFPVKQVCCVGHFDDHDINHAPTWFKLHDGVLHRDPKCGQVFKMVNLKDFDTQTNDHQMGLLEPQDPQNIETDLAWGPNPGKSDNKAMLPLAQVDRVTRFLNPSEHERMLVDYEQRLASAAEAERDGLALLKLLGEIEERMQKEGLQHVPGDPTFETRHDITPEELHINIEHEMNVLRDERTVDRLMRFANREWEDRDDFERRDARMLNRAGMRKQMGVTHEKQSEMELRYFDQYQSELEDSGDQGDVVEETLDRERIWRALDTEKLTLTHAPDLGVRIKTLFERRRFEDGSNFERREKRMREKRQQRLEERDAVEWKFSDLQALKAKEGQQCVQDQFESDKEITKTMDGMADHHKGALAELKVDPDQDVKARFKATRDPIMVRDESGDIVQATDPDKGFFHNLATYWNFQQGKWFDGQTKEALKDDTQSALLKKTTMDQDQIQLKKGDGQKAIYDVPVDVKPRELTDEKKKIMIEKNLIE